MEIIEKDQNPVYVERLKQQLESTKQWGDVVTAFDLELAQDEFMDIVGRLYLDYFQFHIEEGRILSLNYGPPLLSTFDFINQEYIGREYYKLLNVDPEISGWTFACVVKTKIEAFDSLFAHITGRLDDRVFENYLEERKEDADIAGDEIPLNAPKTHWWWYA